MDQPYQKATPAWLEDTVFYQIYPQTYFDSNGDGIGDIPGIIAKLDYIQSLGITGLWLNPCFESPFQDAGYDVTDYYKVAARYGTNADLKHLFDEARKRGIRILLDLVPGHTSLESPWFIESCKPERNQYSDYYIWTDSAWKWQVPGLNVVSGYSQRDASYITNFFYFQPALNYGFANPDPNQPWQQPVDAPGPLKVRQEMKNVMRYWLEQGASGFRVDMAFSLVKGDTGHRETIRLWQEMRAWLDAEYPDACIISEGGMPATAIPAGFHMDFCLQFGTPGYTALLRKPWGVDGGGDPYGFSFFDPIGNGNILEFLDDFLKHYKVTRGQGVIVLPTGNHDTPPRISKGRTTDDLELIYLFLLTMPCVPFIWYGDEIGMRSFDQLVSKEGGYQRTGVRTPMQWSNEPNAGFSTARAEDLYLPIDPSLDRPNVQQQNGDPESLLNRIRKLMVIRKGHPVLQASAEFEVLFAESGRYPFVYKRANGQETYIIGINPSSHEVEALLPYRLMGDLASVYGSGASLIPHGDRCILHMPGVSGTIFKISDS